MTSDRRAPTVDRDQLDHAATSFLKIRDRLFGIA
jgi:hypothetical protein